MKICLDAGHYGRYNRSPVNAAYYESDFTWKFHLLLKAELEKYGIAVITTRPTQGGDLGLEARGRKSAGCDLFLSIHSNACGAASADHPLACCCVSGACDVLGHELAQCVAGVMETTQPGRIWKRRGSDGDYYGVLRGAAAVGTPGILLEHSFHTNLRAVNWLLDESNLRRMAAAEAETIAAYYGIRREAAQSVQNAQDGAFIVRVTCAELNVRRAPGVEYGVTTTVRRGEAFTITETAKARDGGTWGKLKSGAGWINIGAGYCVRV